MSFRVRFAPSPTGQVHIGNMRAAIFNWLFARHHGGRFLLRIEDTDRERSTPEAVQAVLDAMQWLGLDFDEPPVYQSARLAAHLEAADRLLAAGQAVRQVKGEAGQGECIVFKMPGADMTFHDEIKGELRKEAQHLPDFVIVRSNGSPVFHLANVVDDIHMGITHVIRGDDHIENTYRHVALFQALGAPAPKYAHLPMIVNAQGKPYSKRDGAAFVGDFREKGYLPDALLNFLALLGWSPGENRELMSRREMIELFDLGRVKSAAAQMSMDKFNWMNGEYMRRLPDADFEAGCRKALSGLVADTPEPAYFKAVLVLMRERVKLFSDIANDGAFFFTENYPVDEAAFRKCVVKEGIPARLAELKDRLAALPDFTAAACESALRALGTETGIGAGPLIHALRVSVSGLSKGPGLFELMALLGRERVARRLEAALRKAAGGA